MTHQKKSSEKSSVITVVLAPTRLTQSRHARNWPSGRLGPLLPWIPLVASGRRATLQRRSSRQLPQHKSLRQALITSSLAIFSRGPLLGPVHGARRANCHPATCFVILARADGVACRLGMPRLQHQQFPLGFCHGTSCCGNTTLHNINRSIFKTPR